MERQKAQGTSRQIGSREEVITDLNEATLKFIENLKNQENVQGIVLFGSWARGNQRANSDVDLLIIVNKGYKRTAEYLDGQAFEIIYTTVQGAKDYYKTDLDATQRFWKIAKILFDRDGSAEDVKQFAINLTSEGKKPLGDDTLRHFEFDAQDQISFAKDTHNNGDIATANLILSIKMAALTEIYFDTIQEWRPAPKQALSEIKNINSELYDLFKRFYSDDITFDEKVSAASNIVKTIFK